MQNFKRPTYLIAILLCVHCVGIKAQELPPLRNYSPTDYQAENQNWSISQSSDKLIYIANGKGLLEFNGDSWNLFLTPNESIMRSVRVIKDRIYTGNYMDFGFWEKDTYGELRYTSLANQIGIQLIDDEEIWNIIDVDDSILFQSLDRIYIYNTKDESVESIDSEYKIVKIYKLGSNIYFQRYKRGLYKIENGKDVLVADHPMVQEQELINVFKDGNNLLLQTKDDGFYKLKDNDLVKWNCGSCEYIAAVSVYNSIRLKNGGFMIGTISNGLIYLDDNGDLQFQIDKSKGLLNNTVLSLFEDVDNNVWMGLDNGVGKINLDAPYKVYSDNEGKVGSVYASAIYDGNLYLGSNQGLFYKPLKSDGGFTLIGGTQGQVWCLKEIGQTLFCGHDSGTFIVKNNNAKLIANYEGTWDIKPVDDKDILLQGNYDGLYVLEKLNDNWRVRNKIKNFNNSSRHFVVMPGNEIFINHEYKGVFKVKVNMDFTEAMKVSIDSLIKGANSNIIKYNGDLLYSSKDGVFRYELSEKRFKKDSVLSTLYSTGDDFISGRLIHDDKTNKLWGISSSNISLLTSGGVSSKPKIKRIPIPLALRNDLIDYENVLQLQDDDVYLLGNYSGYYTIDIDNFDIGDFRIGFTKITNQKRDDDEASHLLDKSLEGNFKSEENTLSFSFSVPEYYEYLETEYQYQLSGLYDNWSDWSENSTELFENLPSGDYTFKVRAKIGDTLSGNTASYSFKIAKPWYISNLALVLYVVVILLVLYVIHITYKKHYRNQQQRLIERNKRELKLSQVQNEKEIIRLKNEALKSDIKSKSKELAASTMIIIKKNELLTTIKNGLKNLPEKNLVSPVIRIIDKSLKKNDDWEFFKEAFNNADKDFLGKVKGLHPELTPNDLKLCAYLKLNLSSKEIAPLLNISVRSVEVKRYRLRKKMALPHDRSLSDYILNL
ncbi:helix-turn-helix and ligand-binding sensor domain-containing protein [Maribacter arenosus]|uniref:LuxR family transcriptional regulator n=1 Tax=Maribacter arenosus TaxID=1854708 RepID=A0ABR7V8R6_9FLAO|nr:triple tyrosine motif-containing protein [Maribacter arenosus]MBD0849997.1 LuxR family transcriptional regulator [Maribacter arenosus]